MFSDNIKEYFSESQYNSLWLAIAENRLDDAINEIDSHKPANGASVNTVSKDSSIAKAASLMLSSKASNIFSYHRLSINVDDIKEVDDLVRLLVAIHLNGHFSVNERILLNGILEILGYLFIDLRDGAGGYPNNSINALVWISGTWLRVCCDSLANYCDMCKDLDNRIKVLEYKCQVTLSIMSHYPHLVGPDMVMAGEANEAAGNFLRAKQMYSAVIADLQWVADDIENFDEEDVKGMHIYSLEALATAYKRQMHIGANDAYALELNRVETIIRQIKTKA